MLKLAIEPESQEFGPTDWDNFCKAVEEQDRVSIFYPVRSEEEVLLDDDARTVTGGYRYSLPAFFQVCAAICPGLYRFVVELAGDHRRHDQLRSDYSFDAAREIFNDTVRRRFRSRLIGHQFLRNTKQQTVDGVVGASYRWIPNRTLCELSAESMSRIEGHPQFLEGRLNGRWMLMRYYKQSKLFEIDGDYGRDRFIRGYHISNNEIGVAAIRAGSLIVRERGRTSAMIPATFGKVKHLGNALHERIRHLMVNLEAQRLDDADYYQTQMEKLVGTSLGFGQGDRRQAVDPQRDEIVSILTRRKLTTRGAANRVVSDAIYKGSYEADEVRVDHLSQGQARRRNGFDLYNAIGRFAKKSSISVRERAEQIAHSLLVGRIAIPAPAGAKT